ncbi:MAG: DNA mismatch endonuclease Vsr [Methylotetracoccus sp.]
MPNRDHRSELETDPARSALMARVRQRDTRPEQRVAKALRALGHAYRRNVRSLPGSPDFANRKRGWVVFVMGCFWHHHTNCTRATIPKRNKEFWVSKFRTNRLRDSIKIKFLRKREFKVFLIWECQTVSPNRLSERTMRINSSLLERDRLCRRRSR